MELKKFLVRDTKWMKAQDKALCCIDNHVRGIIGKALDHQEQLRHIRELCL